MRCRWCGRDEQEAKASGSTHCNPPFDRKPHLFDGQHPADKRANNPLAVNNSAVINPFQYQ